MSGDTRLRCLLCGNGSDEDGYCTEPGCMNEGKTVDFVPREPHCNHDAAAVSYDTGVCECGVQVVDAGAIAMNASDDFNRLHTLVESTLTIVADGLVEQAGRFTCSEANAITELLRVGLERDASKFADQHAFEDDDDTDEHHARHLELLAESAGAKQGNPRRVEKEGVPS